MATRRMISRRITDSTRFLKMPLTSQALYFHLIQHADDDGVVEAYPVIRSIGANEDDLKILVGKGFATVLNEDFVTYLPDWLEHNSIRADRKVDSIYMNLLIQVIPDVQIKQAKPSYYSTKKIIDGQMADKWQTNDRLGKDSIGKDSIGKREYRQAEAVTSPKPAKKKEIKHFIPPTAEDVKQYCLENDYVLDAERFVDFYECKGWMVGKNKMKDWKAAVRTWIRKDEEGTVKKVSEKPPEEPEQPIDLWSD